MSNPFHAVNRRMGRALAREYAVAREWRALQLSRHGECDCMDCLLSMSALNEASETVRCVRERKRQFSAARVAFLTAQNPPRRLAPHESKTRI